MLYHKDAYWYKIKLKPVSLVNYSIWGQVLNGPIRECEEIFLLCFMSISPLNFLVWQNETINMSFKVPSLLVVLHYFPFPSTQSSPHCTSPASLLVIHVCCWFSYMSCVWITTPAAPCPSPCAALQKNPWPSLHLWIKGGPGWDQCTNLSSLLLPARVKHCVVGRLRCTQTLGVSVIFWSQPAKALGCMVKIDHFARVGGRHLSAPPFGWQLPGIRRDEPDGRYVGQGALRMNRHGMLFTVSCRILQSVTTYNWLTLMLNKWWCVQLC